MCSASPTDRRKRWRSNTQRNIAPRVPSGVSESSAPTSTSTTTTTTEPAVIATQIVDFTLGRNYGSTSNDKSYMRQEVELQIKADARSLPLSVCWDVKADGSKIPWWHWYQYDNARSPDGDQLFMWELPKNERGNDIMGTGCWSTTDIGSPLEVGVLGDRRRYFESNGLTAGIRVDYREPDLYYPTPYRPRFLQIRGRVIDATGFTIISATLEFEK